MVEWSILIGSKPCVSCLCMCLCLPCLLMYVPVYLFSLVWACVPCLLFVQECSISRSLHMYHVSISVWCLLVCEHEYHDSRVCTCVSCLLVVVLVYQVSVYVHVYHVSVFLCFKTQNRGLPLKLNFQVSHHI